MNTVLPIRFRRLLAPLALVLAALMLQGCGLLAKKAQEREKIIDATGKDIVVLATTTKSVYRPGEAVVVTVTARNTTRTTLRVLPLSAESGPPNAAAGPLTFWFGKEGTLDRMQRYPVVSALESRSRAPGGGEAVDLGPGEEMSRQFLLTQITPKVGKYRFQVHVKPFPSEDLKRIGKFYSEPIVYEVYGTPLFRRDTKGLIDLEEAIRLAAAESPGDVQLVDAVLIQDEMGFHRWWVNVDYSRPAGGIVHKAYLVDPYLGRIWSEAKQFKSSIKRDASRVRRDELRKMRERARQNEPEG